MDATCQLCKQQKPLRNSHILPEFLYKNTYDDLHRTLLISSSEKEKFVQKGLREYLLCQDCETKFSRYEGYAAKTLSNISNFEKGPNGLFVFSNNIDYSQFKLYQLSILWRGSVSKNQMFANVNLGEDEETIRKMLYQNEPGKSQEYGCFLIRIPEAKIIHKMIMPPMPEKLFGHNGYRFMIGNLFYYYIVSKNHIQESVNLMFLQDTGTLRVWSAPWKEQEVYRNIGKLINSRNIK